jgi:hypothetical protein
VTNLYFVAGVGACFVVANSDHFSILMGGKLFAASAIPVAFVVLATLHRTYGQVTSTLYYATGNTKLYRNLAVLTSIGGMGVAWIMIAPHQYFGFQLGAVGLAVKTLLAEVLTANVLAVFACRYLGLSYRALLVHQIACGGVLLMLALAVRMTLSLTLPPSGGFIGLALQTALSGFLYMICVGFMVWALPWLAGVERVWLRQQIAGFRAALGTA